MNKKNEEFKTKTEALEYITGIAVGFSVGVYIGKSQKGGNEFQIMPLDEFEAGVEDFWDWHLETNEQWFETPIEAAAEFVKQYLKFRTKDIKPTIQAGEDQL